MQLTKESQEGSRFSTQITESFKKVYSEKKETIEYLCKFGSPIEKAKASLIRDIALRG
jgi:hypothetical protein